MIKARFLKHVLQFKEPAGTSRGVLHNKPTYFLILSDGKNHGIGECGVLPGLSIDDRDGYDEVLEWVCANIHLPSVLIREELTKWPSILFGWEQATRSLDLNGDLRLWYTSFSRGESGQPINGLIWMGDLNFMREQVKKRLDEGFTCLKMKIGAVDLEQELGIIEKLRSEFDPQSLEIRVDANGAFQPNEVPRILDSLARFKVHSIEQPIQAGQWQEMAAICENPSIPVCLDEELIGIYETEEKKRLAQTIRPQFFILKPSLIGGFESSKEWIEIASQFNSGWWMTSALESNIGLNAIAQFTAALGNPMPQGLGTGSLYTNNIPSPLMVRNGQLWYEKDTQWDLTLLDM